MRQCQELQVSDALKIQTMRGEAAACSFLLTFSRGGLANIDIYCQTRSIQQSASIVPEGGSFVSSSLNVQLTDALRKYVDERSSDKDVYATPSEYIRDLIRQDMQDHAVTTNILEGLDDVRKNRFSTQSILDIDDED